MILHLVEGYSLLTVMNKLLDRRNKMKKKNRYLLYLLLCGVMLYYAIPRIPLESSGVDGVFAISWLALALLVIAGNLSAFLYTPKRQGNVGGESENKRKKIRGIAN